MIFVFVFMCVFVFAVVSVFVFVAVFIFVLVAWLLSGISPLFRTYLTLGSDALLVVHSFVSRVLGRSIVEISRGMIEFARFFLLIPLSGTAFRLVASNMRTGPENCIP